MLWLNSRRSWVTCSEVTWTRALVWHVQWQVTCLASTCINDHICLLLNELLGAWLHGLEETFSRGCFQLNLLPWTQLKPQKEEASSGLGGLWAPDPRYHLPWLWSSGHLNLHICSPNHIWLLLWVCFLFLKLGGGLWYWWHFIVDTVWCVALRASYRHRLMYASALGKWATRRGAIYPFVSSLSHDKSLLTSRNLLFYVIF